MIASRSGINWFRLGTARDLIHWRADMRRVLVLMVAFASLLAALAIALAWPERIRLANGGSGFVAHTPLSESSGFPLVVARSAMIVIEGDSLVAGHRGAEAGDPWPARLERLLDGPRVVNRGRGGHTAEQGEERWSDAPGGDLAILLYGANDGAIRGWMGRKRPVPLETYRTVMARKIARHRAAGARVIVLAPLSPGSTAMEARLAPYREAAREVALEQGALFLDPQPAWDDLPVPLQRDGVHVNAAGREALARYLAGRLELR